MYRGNGILSDGNLVAIRLAHTRTKERYYEPTKKTIKGFAKDYEEGITQKVL